MSHEDDVFNNIRMQGHSHVNMGVTPSSVDTSLYDRLLDQLDDTMFYIFMIWNKKKDKTIKIYDLKKNVLFDTSDVTVEQLGGDEDADFQNLSEDEQKAVAGFLASYRGKKQSEAFIKDAKEMVKDKVYKPTTTYGSYGHGNYGGYGGSSYYGGGYYGGYSGSGYSGTYGGSSQTKTEDKKDTSGKKNGMRKGKRKDKKNNGLKNACDSQLTLFNGQDDDDWDETDPFYARGW